MSEQRLARQPGRRFWDWAYYVLPIILSLVIGLISIATTLVMWGQFVGRLEGRLQLIEYKLDHPERR